MQIRQIRGMDPENLASARVGPCDIPAGRGGAKVRHFSDVILFEVSNKRPDTPGYNSIGPAKNPLHMHTEASGKT